MWWFMCSWVHTGSASRCGGSCVHGFIPGAPLVGAVEARGGLLLVLDHVLQELRPPLRLRPDGGLRRGVEQQQGVVLPLQHRVGLLDPRGLGLQGPLLLEGPGGPLLGPRQPGATTTPSVTPSQPQTVHHRNHHTSAGGGWERRRRRRKRRRRTGGDGTCFAAPPGPSA